MTPRAYKIATAEGSRYTVRFDPSHEYESVVYGKTVVIGYSQVAQKSLRITGIAAEPEVGGRLIIESKPWAVEQVNEEIVPLYEYETISWVQDITDMLDKWIDENCTEAQ